MLATYCEYIGAVLMKELHDGAGSAVDAVDVPGALVSRKLWYKFPEKL